MLHKSSWNIENRRESFKNQTGNILLRRNNHSATREKIVWPYIISINVTNKWQTLPQVFGVKVFGMGQEGNAG